jgi:hypothetical protein
VLLDDLVSGSVGSGHAEVRKTLNDCSVKLTGVKLLVTPAGDNVSVPFGGSVSFFVSGGTGVPSGAVVSGPKQGGLPLRLDAGQFRFEYRPDGMAVGDSVVVRFTDGAAQAEHLVEVKVTEAVQDKSTNTTPGAIPGATTGQTQPGPGLATLDPDTRKKLGLGANATEADFTKAVTRCQETAVPAIPKTAVFDSDTQRALGAGQCKPQA